VARTSHRATAGSAGPRVGLFWAALECAHLLVRLPRRRDGAPALLDRGGPGPRRRANLLDILALPRKLCPYVRPGSDTSRRFGPRNWLFWRSRGGARDRIWLLHKLARPHR